MVPYKSHDPIAIGLFSLVGVIVLSKDLVNSIHERSLGPVRNLFECPILFMLSCNG